MNAIKTIYDRLTLKHIKQRTLLLFLLFQNVTLSLVLLILSNIIVVNAHNALSIDYNQIRLLYTAVVILLFIFIYIETPFFLSREINHMYRDNVYDHILAVGVKGSDIVMATYLRGIVLSFVLFFSSLPIACISLSFGGIGIGALLRLFIYFISYLLLASSTSIFISTRLQNGIVSMIFSYLVCLFFLAIYMIAVNSYLFSNYTLIISTILSIFVSIVFLTIARKDSIFSL